LAISAYGLTVCGSRLCPRFAPPRMEGYAMTLRALSCATHAICYTARMDTENTPAPDIAPAADDAAAEAELPEEVGGKKRLEPTRYGDWELNGKCVDF